MRVILLQNVPGVGKVGDLKEVADGYGRNYLIPRKLAAPARSEAVNAIALKLAAKARIEARTEAELIEMAKQLEGREVFLEAKTGGRERLYGSITAADIAAALEEASGYVVDKRKVEIEDSIRQIGTYEVTIRLAKDLVPKVRVTVTEKKAEES